MIRMMMNGREREIPEGLTILDAAGYFDIRIPTLCKHPDLAATGACGLCVVKVKGALRMVRSCTTEAKEGMEVITHDPEIVRVRRTILELILSAHPNECLTCSRNGSCELQELAEEFGIREAVLPPALRNFPRDESTRAIVLDPSKCISCGRCIQVCQDNQNVWALSMMERGFATRMAPAGDIDLKDSPCVRCGQCSAHCPVGAICEYDETRLVWDALLDRSKYCIAQVAPAVRVSLGDIFGYESGTNLIGQLYDTLRGMGFRAVFDTNFGADVTVMEEAHEFTERFLQTPERLPLITTCCPSWVDFMEKFHDDMIDHFSTCKSPHAILGVLSKTYYAEKIGVRPEDIFMVSIMPCTSKKYEISRSSSMFASGRQDVDVSITTRELIRMIKQSGIIINELDCLAEADSPLGRYSGAGAIFGVSGGVMEAALRTAQHLITGEEPGIVEFEELRGFEGIRETSVEIAGKTVRAAVAHGLANVEILLETVRRAKRAGEEPRYHFIEVMACPGGCIGGGGQAWVVDRTRREKRAESLYTIDRREATRFSHANPEIIRLYDEFLESPGSKKAESLLHTGYMARKQYTR